jgi:hypothetical protein
MLAAFSMDRAQTGCPVSKLFKAEITLASVLMRAAPQLYRCL